jgi:hypothetical protein
MARTDQGRSLGARVFEHGVFVVAGAAAVWLGVLISVQAVRLGWAGILVALLAWAVIAYLALPRMHQIQLFQPGKGRVDLMPPQGMLRPTRTPGVLARQAVAQAQPGGTPSNTPIALIKPDKKRHGG